MTTKEEVCYTCSQSVWEISKKGHPIRIKDGTIQIGQGKKLPILSFCGEKCYNRFKRRKGGEKMTKEFNKDGCRIMGKEYPKGHEFNLSEKINDETHHFSAIYTKDVREFIELLKEVGKIRLDCKEDYELFCEDIDKLAGEKLC